MADNSIPRKHDQVVELLEDGADGALAHGVAIGLKQNDETALRAALAPLKGAPAGPGNVPPAVLSLMNKWNAAKAAKVAATTAYNLAKRKGRDLARACVSVLKPTLGNQWNSQWQPAGFTGGSLAVPSNPLALLQTLGSYFAGHPTHESPTFAPTIAVTAAACMAEAEAISTAASASNQSNTAAGTAKANLEFGLAAARTRLSGLRDELTQLLGDDDERWYAFGFDKPSDPDTPAVPENVVIVPGAPASGMIFVDWNDSIGGVTFRATVNTTAIPPVVVQEKIVSESEATFSGLTAGQAIKVTVAARNSKGGESAPSAPVSGTVP